MATEHEKKFLGWDGTEQFVATVKNLLDSKADDTHNHDTKYDTKGAANSALASAKTYADDAASTVKTELQTAINGKAANGHKHSANDITSSGYLNIHPENTAFTLIPFINNDIAFLDKKGGSCSYYTTTSTDYTVASLNQTSMTISNAANMFDGSPSYATLPTSTTYTAVIDLTLHKTFAYSNQFYIDFGSANWRAKKVSIYVMNSTTETKYTQKGSIPNLAVGAWSVKFSHTSTNTSGSTVQGFNRLRIVLSDFNNASNRRIAQIGLVNYGSAGVTETFISRGGCSGVYGSLIPHTTNNVDLGSSSKKWKNVYATTFTGSLSGNASTATKATQDASGNVITSTYATKTELNSKVSEARVNELISNALASITNGEEVAY